MSIFLPSRYVLPLRRTHGFTLVELLVVISVIVILITTIAVSVNESSQQGLDLERQIDLRQLQVAVENYKRQHGVYPEACTGPNTWSGETDCFDYIEDLRPQFISVLPTDPRRGDDDGFVYRTNENRTVYKIMVRGTVESEVVTATHTMAPCPTTPGWCGCDESAPLYETSYAVWGGYAAGANEAAVQAATESVVCEL